MSMSFVMCTFRTRDDKNYEFIIFLLLEKMILNNDYETMKKMKLFVDDKTFVDNILSHIKND